MSVNYAVETMHFGHTKGEHNFIVEYSLLQGGMVGIFVLAVENIVNCTKNSVYYVGMLVGCLLGGWIGKKVGRIKVIALGSLWGVFQAFLQTSAQNAKII